MNRKDLSKFSDEELVLLLKKNDAKILEEIYERYWEKLFRFSNKLLLDEEAAKDIVQEIFIKLWERRDTLFIKNVNAYLLQSAKYKVASYLRKGKFSERHSIELDKLSIKNNIVSNINRDELDREIKLSLSEVAPRSREVFYLSRYRHLKNQEIADKLGISIRTVETHISNVLKHLRTNDRITA